MNRNTCLPASVAPGSTEEDVLFHELTRREQQVLHLVAQGRANKEIARDLQISVFTVQNHMQNLYHTLGISNRAEATCLYWQRRSMRHQATQ